MITRRRFLQGSAALLGTAVSTAIYARYVEPQWVEYVKRPLPIRNLPAHMAGRTLVQLSDLHIGNRFDPGYLINALQKVATMEPDYVVYTGDYVTYDSPEQFDQLRTVMMDAPNGRFGTAAVLGNHDYGRNWFQPEVANEIVNILTERGITVLRNRAHCFAGLQIMGIDDAWGTNFSPVQGLAAIQSEQPTIVLCHNPDVADKPIWQGYQGWILAGHTHGGQVKPPFLPPPMLPVSNERYTAGEFELENGRFLYINRALGSLWPVRFNVRPEVTIFTLERLG